MYCLHRRLHITLYRLELETFNSVTDQYWWCSARHERHRAREAQMVQVQPSREEPPPRGVVD